MFRVHKPLFLPLGPQLTLSLSNTLEIFVPSVHIYFSDWVFILVEQCDGFRCSELNYSNNKYSYLTSIEWWELQAGTHSLILNVNNS